MARIIDAVLRLRDEFSGNLQRSINSMTNMSRASLKVSRDIQKAGESITKAGKNLTAALTVPIVGAGIASTKLALDFENGIAKVSTIADTSAMSLDQLRQETLNLSNQMGVSVAEISEAQYQAISAGAKTADSLGLVRTASMAAKAGFTDTATAIDGLTTVYNSYQGAVDYSAIADQMMMTQNYGKTSFGELASSMGQVTPIANALHVSTEELFSSVAVLTKNGIATSSAVTGMKAAYSNILKPTSHAQKEAKKLGLEFNAAHLESVGWAKFMEEIKDKTGGNTESMAKLFGSVEALNSMTVLAGEGFGDFTNALNEMNKAAGLTQQSYEKMLTPAERWNIAMNKIKNAGIQVGEKLLPVFERITSAVGEAADRFQGLSDEQLNTVIKIAGIAAAAGPAVIMFGNLVTGVGKALFAFNKFGLAIKTVGGIIPILTSPVAIVVGGLIALVAVIVLAVKNFDKIKAAVKRFASNFTSEFGVVKSLIAQIKSIVKSVAPAFQSMAAKIGPLIASIKTAMEPVLEFLYSVFIQKIKIGFAGLAGFVSGFITQLKPVLNGLITQLDGIITFLTGVFTGNWSQAWEGIKGIFKGIFEQITGIAKGVINGVAGAINGVIQAVNNAGFTIPEWVPKVGGTKFSVNIPEIPMLAKGTAFWQGGLAQVHERGGEIIDLPHGSRVYPHDESVSMARREGINSGSVAINKLADQIIIREEADIEKITDMLIRKIQKARLNMGRA